jgi:hypothetical protein
MEKDAAGQRRQAPLEKNADGKKPLHHIYSTSIRCWHRAKGPSLQTAFETILVRLNAVR